VNEIFFVDDEPDILEGLRSALRRQRSRWNMRFAVGGEAALRELALSPCDVIVSDMRMPGMDGLTLLGLVRDRHPQTSRIVLSGHADLDTVIRSSAVAHQYLSKPCDTDSLCTAIERALEVQALVGNPELRRVIGGLGTLPTPPRTYAALTAALADPDVDMKRLSAIVERDMGLAVRALQLVNSAYCGLARRVTSLESAITMLGLNTLRHLALTVEVFRGFGGEAPSELEALERHAVLTARIARKIVPDPKMADIAFAAGLLHDAGKLLFLSRVPEAYRGALERAERTELTALEAERESIGATHAEVGALLLAMWDLPHAIIQPVAHHHAPPRAPQAVMDASSAVSLADALAHEATGGSSRATTREVEGTLARFGDIRQWQELARAEARAG